MSSDVKCLIIILVVCSIVIGIAVYAHKHCNGSVMWLARGGWQCVEKTNR